MDATKLQELHAFVKFLRANPKTLDLPELSFFKDFCLSVAEAEKTKPSAAPKPPVVEEMDVDEDEEPEEEEEEEEPEEPEPVVDLPPLEPDPDVIPEEHEPVQEVGDAALEVTEEMEDAAQVEKGLASEAMAEGKLEEAIKHFTNAVKLNPHSSILYANRATCFLQMKKPRSAIRDCDEGLRLNPDSGKAYKVRGKAYALIGHYDEAARDLRLGEKIDHDDATFAVLKKVEARLHLIHEREQRIKDAKDRADKARAAKAKAQADAKASKGAGHQHSASCNHPPHADASGSHKPAPGAGFPGGMPGMAGMGGMPGMAGFPGMGGMPGMAGLSPDLLQKLMQDPQILTAIQNPKVMAAVQAIMTDPSKIALYRSDPEVGPVLSKLMDTFGAGAGAAPPRPQPAPAASQAPPFKKPSVADDLD
eukprot:CAMPEP_0196656596 /NCGR_PEP_ID=MMETSP1086-20130531/18683_1 /TAXON_ID=77921 /ORGANISM="Cyanoptyche  gloeocystis , Strain SAG4.97" /LENGTH=419 /DNA_ID=CAMNT_0041989419 /DNA_START=71 /DNA_END=1330 /DNA_ORIENTATION=+